MGKYYSFTNPNIVFMIPFIKAYKGKKDEALNDFNKMNIKEEQRNDYLKMINKIID